MKSGLIFSISLIISSLFSNLGKAKYSIPFLLQHGFEMIENEYQVILRRIS